MIKLTFKYDSETIVTVDDVSRLSNKNVFRMFEEAVTQHVKWKLVHELLDIRERMEIEGVEIEYDLNSKTEEFVMSYLAKEELANLIKSRL
jgi:hypothetical protein